jgi:hypothetical protein
MSSRRAHPTLILAAVFVILLLAGMIGFFLRSPTGSTEGTIAIGIASSLIASFVFVGVSAVMIGSRGREMSEHLASLGSSVAALTAAVPLLAQGQVQQVRAIKAKGDYTPDEWLAVLRDAESLLIMVGHALDKWCRSEQLEAEFRDKVKDVLRRGGEVRMLMLAENAQRVPELRRKEYADRVRHTLTVLAEISRELTPSERARLTVSCLGDRREMHYMAVANERFVITAPYPTTMQNSDPMPALTLGSESKIARELMVDIRSLLDDGASNEIDLTSYIEQNLRD